MSSPATLSIHTEARKRNQDNLIAQPLQIVGIAGSLRRGSFNRALLRDAVEMAPDGLAIQVHDLGDVPLYNGDVEAEGLPEAVVGLRQAIEEADGLLIVTPEYNRGLPAVTKNAIDWLSRPPRPQKLDGKPVGIMGASPGHFGTICSQMQLRQSLVHLNAQVLAQPQVFVYGAKEKFDADLRLNDDATREIVERFLNALESWVGSAHGRTSAR